MVALGPILPHFKIRIIVVYKVIKEYVSDTSREHYSRPTVWGWA